MQEDILGFKVEKVHLILCDCSGQTLTLFRTMTRLVAGTCESSQDPRFEISTTSKSIDNPHPQLRSHITFRRYLVPQQCSKTWLSRIQLGRVVFDGCRDESETWFEGGNSKLIDSIKTRSRLGRVTVTLEVIQLIRPSRC